ncbi:MAG TPA: EamA family transporter [Thermoleophilaceae bacterium]|nr:EamA family transporter [Thermoleophilaceae bacterium]
MSRATASPHRGVVVPPTLLVLGGVTSVQFGAALAKSLFDDIGVGGTVWLRVALAAVILAAFWRPSVRGHPRADVWLLLLFGVSLAGMNLAFYASLDRIPLGVAVTLEFVGPLGVAVAGSRRALDLGWVVLAAAGILLLSDLGGDKLDALGMALALLAGGFWAAYILLAARVGRGFPGGGGLALSMVVAGLLLTPIGIAQGGAELLDPLVLAIALGVAVLSSAIPYSLELEALRRMPASVFGVLMSLEPGVAALVGFLLLSEGLVTREVVAIGLVVAASAGAARTASADRARQASPV